MEKNRQFVFDDVSEENFDFNKEWIVTNIDPINKSIQYLYHDPVNPLTLDENYSSEIFEKRSKQANARSGDPTS